MLKVPLNTKQTNHIHHP